jgi:hypothetical protein
MHYMGREIWHIRRFCGKDWRCYLYFTVIGQDSKEVGHDCSGSHGCIYIGCSVMWTIHVSWYVTFYHRAVSFWLQKILLLSSSWSDLKQYDPSACHNSQCPG